MAPGFARLDKGPEFIAHAVAEWFRFNCTASVSIDPDSPWQNACVDSFNDRFRAETLNGRLFDDLLEAHGLTEDQQIDDNFNRPHSAHGDLRPADFAQDRSINKLPTT